jgi:hypothetical protein
MTFLSFLFFSSESSLFAFPDAPADSCISVNPRCQKATRNFVRLLQCNGLLGTEFLAAETTDACIGIHPGNVIVSHGKGRHRTLIYTGAAARAQIGIGMRTHDYTIVNQRLNGLIVKQYFAAEGRKFEIR